MKTLIVNYAGLNAGGVEKFLQRLIRYALKEGNRIIWFTYEQAVRDALCRDVVDDPRVEKVLFASGRRRMWRSNPKFELGENEDVVMISFTPEDYVWAEQFRQKYKCNTFYHHLILMNFFGFLTYPEDEFKLAFLRKKREKFSSVIAHKLDENDNVRAFDKKQLVAYKERYNLKYEISSQKILKTFSIEDGITVEELRTKARERENKFVIVTCARFAFPHKGYLMGLLDVFKEIYEKHNQVKMIMVGDSNVEEFQNKYNSLPENVREAISFTGVIPFDELTGLYRQGHLIIGLAGSILTAASMGLPALVVRHDTYECETYGFYHQVGTSLKDEPGDNIIPYIESLLSVSEDEYINIGVRGRETYTKGVTVDPDYILNETNRSSNASVTKSDIMLNKVWAIVSILKKYFHFL